MKPMRNLHDDSSKLEFTHHFFDLLGIFIASTWWDLDCGSFSWLSLNIVWIPVLIPVFPCCQSFMEITQTTMWILNNTVYWEYTYLGGGGYNLMHFLIFVCFGSFSCANLSVNDEYPQKIAGIKTEPNLRFVELSLDVISCFISVNFCQLQLQISTISTVTIWYFLFQHVDTCI